HCINGVLIWATTQELVFEGNEVTVTGSVFNPVEPITAARIRFNIFRHHSPHSHASTFGLNTPRECLVEGNIWENTGRGVTQNCMPAHAWALKHNLYMHNIFRNLRKTDGEIIYFETGNISWHGSVSHVSGRKMTLSPAPDYNRIGQHNAAPGNQLPQRTVVISEGKGLGQIREVTATDGAVIEVERPWDSEPDATSHVVILTGAVVENLLVGNEYFDSHQWVGIYGAGVRNAWVNDIYERVSGGTDLWKIDGYRLMALNLIYGNKYHERAGIAVVNSRDGGGETDKLQVFGNEIRNNSIEDRRYVSTENGQNAPRLLGWQVRRDKSEKSNALSPLPGREPGIGIFDMLGHPEMGAVETDPAYDTLPISTKWNLIYGNQIVRCPIGIEIGKAVGNTIIIGNLITGADLPINDMGRGTRQDGNVVYQPDLKALTSAPAAQ
ncbi:MAG: hypothetical protein Q8O57_00260, partial [Kiritimatiellota bacterium]|nr:hypothetical protein [Kiritimatiellota bacterium]